MHKQKKFDVIIIGAGAAGLFCAAEALKRGKTTCILEHTAKPGGKILISGGGRCNFTNLEVSEKNFVSQNLSFCRSALNRFTSKNFIELVQNHTIAFHEKKLGQLFCNESAKDILNMLLALTQKAELKTQCLVTNLKKETCFSLQTSLGDFLCDSLVLATGGLSIPQMGATDFGHRVATQFGHTLVPTAPALVGFVFNKHDQTFFNNLQGVSHEVILKTGGAEFKENILFTHEGLSGPAALQGSLYWHENEPLTLNFLPQFTSKTCFEFLKQKKETESKKRLKTVLEPFFADRLKDKLLQNFDFASTILAEISNKNLEKVATHLTSWNLTPQTTVGYAKAEVTRGGVDTTEINPQTFESLKTKGLFIIGEVLDVTGWLGGYNFQWAWSSGFCAGQSV